MFSFIHQKFCYENQKFNFPAKICEIRKKFQVTKFFILIRSTTLSQPFFYFLRPIEPQVNGIPFFI